MTFSNLIDWYLYLVLEAPYAMISFSLIWLLMYWKSNGTLEIGSLRLAGGIFATIIGAGTLLTLANSLVFFMFRDAFFEHEILPNIYGHGMVVSFVFAVAVPIGVCSFLKTRAKPMVALAA